jgi:hypothetical protein
MEPIECPNLRVQADMDGPKWETDAKFNPWTDLRGLVSGDAGILYIQALVDNLHHEKVINTTRHGQALDLLTEVMARSQAEQGIINWGIYNINSDF